MPKPDNTLDEILSTHLNEIKAGHNGKLRQAILQWVADEVVGVNPPEPSEYASDEEFAYYRGQFLARNKQRDILRAHGWKERDDE